MDGIIYLACPYTDADYRVRAERVTEADRITGLLMELGFVVFSPITYSNALNGFAPLNYGDRWYDFDLAFLRKCESVYVLCMEGWEESKGVTLEIKTAKELGMMVRYIRPENVIDAFSLSCLIAYPKGEAITSEC